MFPFNYTTRITRGKAAFAISCWLLGSMLMFYSGCAANKAYVIHPGSIAIGNDGGAFDSRTADYLSDTRAFLDSFKGKTEPQPVANALLEAEEYYQKAKTAYLAWRTAQTAVNLATLNQAKTTLTTMVGKVATAQANGGSQ